LYSNCLSFLLYMSYISFTCLQLKSIYIKKHFYTTAGNISAFQSTTFLVKTQELQQCHGCEEEEEQIPSAQNKKKRP
jgi:hypothetical protein